MSRDEKAHDGPAPLVAIAVAARGSGDKTLARDAAEKLKERFGVRLVFTRKHRTREGQSLCK